MAWVAPGLMLMAALGKSGAAAFRIGCVAGLAFYMASLYWLLLIPVSFAPIIGWLALGGYLSIYPAIWVWLCWKLYPKQTPPELRPAGGQLAQFLELLDWFLATPWSKRLGWTVCCAALWVGLEMIRARLFTGFPWNLLGVSQYRILPIIQIASVTGVYGVSFLMAWFSISLASAFVMLLRRPQVRWHAQRELLLPFVITAAVVATGWWALVQKAAVGSQSPESASQKPKITAALIQPSIPQAWIWDPTESSNRFQQLLQLSAQALTNHPDVLIWPEAAVPYMLRFDEEIHTAVTNLVRTHKVWLILGSDDAEAQMRPNGSIATNFFNSSFLINPDGEVMATYRKRRLVIFGEYIPFGRQFAFIESLTGMGSFTPGKRAVSFSMPDLHAKAAILICFEDAFPHLTRVSIDDDTDFLLDLTNNGWFGESAAQWQHAANAVFRAVENGLPLVRCANNGLTCSVDSQGHMSDIFFPTTDNVYGVGFKLVEVPLLGEQKRPPTFYHQYGDWFGWCCVGLVGGVLVFQFGWERAGFKKLAAA